LPDRDIRPLNALSVNPNDKLDILIGGDQHGVDGAGGLWRCRNTNSPVWENVHGTGSTSLPMVGIRGIARDPDNPTSVWYVASEVGMFYTADAGATWANANAPLGLPNVAANDVQVNRTTRFLTVGTFGRGAWRIPLSGGSLPDLVVTSSSMSPTNPRVGNSVRFTATVKNQGTAPTPSGVIHGVTFSVDGAVKTSSTTSTSPLAVGGSRTIAASSTWTATSGTHALLVRVDDVNRISESAETNNTRSSSFTVAP
jgi:hypothetical protein